jgi:hypothetical protein
MERRDQVMMVDLPDPRGPPARLPGLGGRGDLCSTGLPLSYSKLTPRTPRARISEELVRFGS